MLSIFSERLFQTFGNHELKCYSLTDGTRTLTVGRFCMFTQMCLSVLSLVLAPETHEAETEPCKSRQLNKCRKGDSKHSIL